MTMLRVLAERAQCLVASPALLQANEAGPGLRRIICARRQPAQAQLPDPASVNSPVFASLIPVILCIGAGFLAARLGWVRAAAIKDLFHLVFLRSEEHTSELQSPCNLVCRLLLEKKKS